MEVQKGLMGCLRPHCSETKLPVPLMRASRPERGMKTMSIWSATPDALTGTEFAEGGPLSARGANCHYS